jgi:hypothetical protein
MTMRSSVGVIDAERRSALALAAVALAALALSLVLAFVSTRLHFPAARSSVARPAADRHAVAPARGTQAAPRLRMPTVAPPVLAGSPVLPNDGRPASLWTLLAPWALGVDALALVGLAAALAVHRSARRRRRGARA